MSDEEGYIKEGDLVLIKSGKNIEECKVLDFSPSGEFLKVGDSMGRHPSWTRTKFLLEILKTSNAPLSEYIDIGEEGSVTAQDILARIRGRAEYTLAEIENDENDESVVIQMDKFVELDLRNKKK